MRFAIMMRSAVAGALVLPLAACLGDGEGALGLRPNASILAEAPRRVAVFGGNVVVTGPEGYCVDPGSVQKQRDAAFALLASCTHMGRAPQSNVWPAVVTVSVLGRDAGAAQPTAARLAAPWANSGVIDQIDSDGISLIQLERGGDALLPGGDPRHWRGALVINDHMIGLAVYGEAGSGMRAGTGRALLIAAAEAMRDASPRKRAVQADAPATPAKVQTAAPDGEDAKASPKLSRKARPGRELKSLVQGLFRKPA